MTTSQSDQEPTLADIALQLAELKQSDDQLRQEVQQFNERFSHYQQAMQWVVQLAFTLLISATIALVVSALTFLLRP